MLSIDISFKINELDCNFKAEIERGKPYIFQIGQQIIIDKLFWVLVGLDKNYSGTINGEGICFNATSWNNVLAIGDKTMFIRGSVRKNIYKALRIRSDKKTAKERTEEIIKIYDLQALSNLSIKLLDESELLKVSIARAHYRNIALVAVKNHAQIDLHKWSGAYIIKIV